MALWQFELDLIPASAARVQEASVVLLSREQQDEIKLLWPADMAQRLFNDLNALLPEASSWSPRLRLWGDDKSDDVQVWLEGEQVETVHIRFNAGSANWPLLRGLCAVAVSFDCVFATSGGVIVQPKSEAVARALLQSNAMKFVRDPKAFLDAAIISDVSAD